MSGSFSYDLSVDLFRRQLGDFPPKSCQNHTQLSLSGLDRWLPDLDLVGQLEGHRGSVYSLAWSESGSLLASAGDDNGLRIFKSAPDSSSSANFNLLQRIDTKSVLSSVAFTPHSGERILVGAGSDSVVRVFDIETFHPFTLPITQLRGHSKKVRRVVTEQSPYLFVTCADDGFVKQWDRRERRPRSTLAHCPGSELLSVSISPSQPHYFVVGGTKHTCLVYDRRMTAVGSGSVGGWTNFSHSTRTFASRCVKQFPDFGRSASDVKISDYNPDEVAVSWVNGPVQLFSISRPNIQPRPLNTDTGFKRKRSREHQIRTRVPGNRSTVGRDGGIDVGADSASDIEGERQSSPLSDPNLFNPPKFSGHRNSRSFKEITFLGPCDELIACGCDSGHLFIWERNSGKLAQLLRVGIDPVTSVKPHPDQSFLAVGSLGSAVSLFSPDARDQVAEMKRAAAFCDTQPDLLSEGPFAILRHILGQVIADDDMAEAASMAAGLSNESPPTVTAPSNSNIPVFASDPPENLPSRRRIDCADQVIARNDTLQRVPSVRIHFGSGRPELRLAVGTTVHLAINGHGFGPTTQGGTLNTREFGIGNLIRPGVGGRISSQTPDRSVILIPESEDDHYSSDDDHDGFDEDADENDDEGIADIDELDEFGDEGLDMDDGLDLDDDFDTDDDEEDGYGEEGPLFGDGHFESEAEGARRLFQRISNHLNGADLSSGRGHDMGSSEDDDGNNEDSVPVSG